MRWPCLSRIGKLSGAKKFRSVSASVARHFVRYCNKAFSKWIGLFPGARQIRGGAAVEANMPPRRETQEEAKKVPTAN